MAIKNKNRTEADARRICIFGSNLVYEKFCVEWEHLCTRINPKRNIENQEGTI